MASVGYHILMPHKHYDFQDSFVLDDENLGRLFHIHSMDFSLAFRKVLGKKWIANNSGCFLGDIASQFPTVCMDVLLDSDMVRAIFDTYFSPHFYTSIDLDSALCNYCFEFGDFDYAGFISRSQLLSLGWHGELLSILRNGLISNLYDDTLFALVALLDHVSPDCLAAAINIFVGIHFLLESMSTVRSLPIWVSPIQMVPPSPPLEGPSYWSSIP